MSLRTVLVQSDKTVKVVQNAFGGPNDPIDLWSLQLINKCPMAQDASGKFPIPFPSVCARDVRVRACVRWGVGQGSRGVSARLAREGALTSGSGVCVWGGAHPHTRNKGWLLAIVR